jgi:hypothetical protein
MRITKKDSMIVINGMGRVTFYKDKEPAIYLDLKLLNTEFKNFNFIHLNSTSFINKLKSSLTVLKYVWSK